VFKKAALAAFFFAKKSFFAVFFRS